MGCCSGQGGPNPTGDILRNPVECTSELSLEMSQRLGGYCSVTLIPHWLKIVPGELTSSQFCSQANFTRC